MIDIKKLKKEDIGKWVEHTSSSGLKATGKLKSWNNKYIFVVYKCAGNWNKFQDYTAIATRPEDLIFI